MRLQNVGELLFDEPYLNEKKKPISIVLGLASQWKKLLSEIFLCYEVHSFLNKVLAWFIIS